VPTIAPGSTAAAGPSAVCPLRGVKVTYNWGFPRAAHLSKTGKGGVVQAGDVIGYAGASGDAKGSFPHLHLEVRPLDGRPINPSKLLVGLCTS